MESKFLLQIESQSVHLKVVRLVWLVEDSKGINQKEFDLLNGQVFCWKGEILWLENTHCLHSLLCFKMKLADRLNNWKINN